jgi:Pyruvate/2-oxoacid:ferredoxin oxidoreductase gamma subunit
LGAFAKSTGLVSLEGIKEAIEQKFFNKNINIINKNIKAVETAYKSN